MKLSLERGVLADYVARQISAVLPDRSVAAGELEPHLSRALERAEHCFSRLRVKHFQADGQPSFNHLHTDQYAAFLYLLSNTVHRDGGAPELAAKLYAMNKALHALDAYFEVELPSVFAFQHPVGTVLGRATYGDYLYVYQRCSIGSNVDGVCPTIGSGVVMYGGSAIIGDCTVGDECVLSVGALVMDTNIPPTSVVFGTSPNLVIKPARRRLGDSLFRRD